MQKYLFLVVLFIAVPLAAYQTGPANRANFGAASQQQPAAQSNGYRSFTNANNKWRQGVQTQSVQTSVAGSSATEFEPAEKKKAPVAVKQVAATPAANNKPGAPAAAPTNPSAEAASAPANADPTAMLQQVQGMMQGMQGMMQGGAAANGQQQPAATGQNAMPAGMPDISALMGGMMPAAAPATAPAKK